jgi:hypothetical protein
VNENVLASHIAPVGLVEPHAPLLNVPADGQLLYKMMKSEDLLRSITGAYLHFNRVDSYGDLRNADEHDGQQLPSDQPSNAMARFERAPDFSAADYYNRSRSRTYACCFSIENSEYVWKEYADESEKGKVCVVFNFGKLRAMLNQVLKPGAAALEYGGIRCHQIFSVNYGIVEYVEWDSHRANREHLLNPIRYTYLKDRKRFSEEKELRISLSALGVGEYALNDGTVMNFRASLQAPFDFRASFADGTIQQILYGPDCDSNLLCAELRKLRILPSEEQSLRAD